VVKALDLKSNGISRAGSNPAAVVCFATVSKELSFAFDFFDKKVQVIISYVSRLNSPYMSINKMIKDMTSVGFEPTPEDWCLKPAP
jgi:hypothetical protein